MFLKKSSEPPKTLHLVARGVEENVEVVNLDSDEEEQEPQEEEEEPQGEEEAQEEEEETNIGENADMLFDFNKFLFCSLVITVLRKIKSPVGFAEFKLKFNPSFKFLEVFLLSFAVQDGNWAKKLKKKSYNRLFPDGHPYDF